jgi:hypothetical protein
MRMASAMAWATMRRLANVKVSEMTARQPSVPKWMGILYGLVYLNKMEQPF